ncbi:pupal cuticle protein-like [Oratosquilla oratoria]|uniref:pupal cuticle protein-like n=1 Tax=Oratosquilla oratoria TaxID=337810 RepID=UPI003F76994A
MLMKATVRRDRLWIPYKTHSSGLNVGDEVVTFLTVFQVAALCVLLALANAAPRPDDDSAKALSFVAILKDVRVQPDALGVHSLDFEAENGIAVKTVGSHGSEGGSVMQGAFNYRFDDGTFLLLTFVADEFGYRPESPLLPVAPLAPPPGAPARP